MGKTCFVIMGYETKKIPNTNIKVNLDDTYKYLIKPVLISKGLVSIYLDEQHKHAYRGDELFTTQAINDTYMRNLYLADIVVADITTLNQNAIYELGMRHAMKPKSTIIMCDKKTLESNKFFDLTFNPQILYDSEKQKDLEEITRVSDILASVIETCLNSNENYIDSPVFSLGIYEKKIELTQHIQESKKKSLRTEIDTGKKLIENEDYARSEQIFKNILKKYQYIDNDIICSYILSTYKKEISIENLNKALDEMNNYIDLNNTTCENALGISAAINLRLFNLTKEPRYLYTAIDFYRKGSNFESGNIYCSRNYCTSLLKIYLIEDKINILREYYYTAVHYAKIFLTQAQIIKRDSDAFNNTWFYSNQSDLFLIALNIENMPYNITHETKRQKTTIENGRADLVTDLSNLKQKLKLDDL